MLSLLTWASQDSALPEKPVGHSLGLPVMRGPTLGALAVTLNLSMRRTAEMQRVHVGELFVWGPGAGGVNLR